MKNLKLSIGIIFFTIFIMEESFSQDWANLSRFEKENAQMSTPADDENRIVFFGNSITEGWLQDSMSFFYSKSYINRGISGQTTPQMLIRFRSDVVDLKPKVVVILAGINDIAGNTGPSTLEMIMDNIKSMAEIAKANGIKVVLCSVLRAAHIPWRSNMEAVTKVMKLNQMIKAYTTENGVIYLDYFTAMADEQNGLKQALTHDGVHPNLTGYKIMEPLAEEAVAKALSEL